MSNIVQIGYTTEGTTDQRFLSNIIRKAFEYAVFDCITDIEVYEPEYLPKPHGDFVTQIRDITSRYSYFHVICVHCDSDSPSVEDILKNKIDPAFKTAKNQEKACKNLVAVIPVQMTEAWLLADFDLLKTKLGTKMSNDELGLPSKISHIEGLADPKEIVAEAIRQAQNHLPKRRRKITVSSLYSPISQEISINLLIQLPSFKRFLNEVRKALQFLNYLN